jgi:hypothetical protein
MQQMGMNHDYARHMDMNHGVSDVDILTPRPVIRNRMLAGRIRQEKFTRKFIILGAAADRRSVRGKAAKRLIFRQMMREIIARRQMIRE